MNYDDKKFLVGLLFFFITIIYFYNYMYGFVSMNRVNYNEYYLIYLISIILGLFSLWLMDIIIIKDN